MSDTETILIDGLNEALNHATAMRQQRDHWKSMADGYRDALAELAGSIPMDNYMKMVGSDHPLAQALGQANLVLQEGPQ
jgi:hypothetical protein